MVLFDARLTENELESIRYIFGKNPFFVRPYKKRGLDVFYKDESQCFLRLNRADGLSAFNKGTVYGMSRSYQQYIHGKLREFERLIDGIEWLRNEFEPIDPFNV